MDEPWVGATYERAGAEVCEREDPPGAPTAPDEPIDCAARLHLCHAVCCRLPFPLSPDEVEAGVAEWEPDRPYWLRRRPDGMCVHHEEGSLSCTIYEDRPRPCRTYSCRHDRRIWRDFDAMELNTPVVDALRSAPVGVYVSITAKPPAG